MPTQSLDLGFEIPPDSLEDGLYWVERPYLAAGFVVKGGKVITCAPILRKKFSYWLTVAVRIADA